MLSELTKQLISKYKLVKSHFSRIPVNVLQHTLTSILIIATGTAAFGLGKLAHLEKERTPVEIVNADGSKVSASLYSFKSDSKAGHAALLLGSTTSIDNNIQTSATPIVKMSKPALSPSAVKKKPKTSPTPLDEDIQIRYENATIIGVKSSKRYYFPWCGTISRLSESNAVVFASIDEARKAGYTPAKNCKGLQ